MSINKLISLGPLWRVNRRLRNVKGEDMKIFQTPSYDRFCLFEMERKSKDFRGMDDNVAYKNKQMYIQVLQEVQVIYAILTRKSNMQEVL